MNSPSKKTNSLNVDTFLRFPINEVLVCNYLQNYFYATVVGYTVNLHSEVLLNLKKIKRFGEPEEILEVHPLNPFYTLTKYRDYL